MNENVSVLRCCVGLAVFACTLMFASRLFNGSWWAEYWLVLTAWNLHTLLDSHRSLVEREALVPLRNWHWDAKPSNG